MSVAGGGGHRDSKGNTATDGLNKNENDGKKNLTGSISQNSKAKKVGHHDSATNNVYQKLLDPETLLDYNPVDGGLRIGVAGLAGLPLGENSIYKVSAEIRSESTQSSFVWSSRPHYQKSIDGTY